MMHPAYPTRAELRAEAEAARADRITAASNAIYVQISRLEGLLDQLTEEGDADTAEAAAEALRLGVDQLLTTHARRSLKAAA